MPKDKVEAAIAKASGADAESYDELIYEGYAPHGIALVIVTATDNPTRTVANVRLALKKGEGNLKQAVVDLKVLQRKLESLEKDEGNWAQKAEESVKVFISPGLFFEALGFKYVGPVDGHRVDTLLETFTNVRAMVRMRAAST